MSFRTWSDDELRELVQEAVNLLLPRRSARDANNALRIEAAKGSVVDGLLRKIRDKGIELSSDREKAVTQIKSLYPDPLVAAAKILRIQEAA